MNLKRARSVSEGPNIVLIDGAVAQHAPGVREGQQEEHEQWSQAPPFILPKSLEQLTRNGYFANLVLLI
jgi:hypothetical protein